MITREHIRERLENQKEPLPYIDEEISRRLDLMSGQCQNVQDIIRAYSQRENRDEQFDLQRVKDEFRTVGELYIEINLLQKARKELVKRQKRSEQLSNAQAKHKKWVEKKYKQAPGE